MQKEYNGFWHKFVEKQLQYRYWVLAALTLATAIFAYFVFAKLEVRTNFYDLYPPKHKYIQLYQEFRKMFGSANVLNIVIERTDGKEIYQVDSLKKVDEITQAVLAIKGVNPLQVSSATHPKVKQIVINAFGVGVFPLTHPSVGYPKTKAEAEHFRNVVYSQEGVRGFFISLDDKSAAVYAALWEEGLDFGYLYNAIQELKQRIEDENHRLHISGYPMLYAWMDYYKFQLVAVLLITIAAIVLTLLIYFRSFRGFPFRSPRVSSAPSGASVSPAWPGLISTHCCWWSPSFYRRERFLIPASAWIATIRNMRCWGINGRRLSSPMPKSSNPAWPVRLPTVSGV